MSALSTIRFLTQTVPKVLNLIGLNTTSRNAQKQANQELAKTTAREDAIRLETQEREDNAYQRAVEDMKKAGIDVAQVQPTLNPSASGGGITNASRQFDTITEQQKAQYNYFQSELDKNFQMSENEKDRLTGIFKEALNIGADLKSKGLI